MNQIDFETKLNALYGGAVRISNSNRYLNKHTTLRFICSDCGATFFGKPSYMVGKDHQQHVCNKPYGTANGKRTSSVSAIKGSNPRRSKKKKDKGTKIDMELLNKMIWEDYTYQQIASELKINPNIVRNYFKSEGLIE
ncbi:adenylate kinase [Priestia aryabhattai]|nr:adenylate kinase [Priestia aryabhattai]